MAKRVVPRNPELDTAPLQWNQMSPSEQGALQTHMDTHFSNISEEMGNAAATKEDLVKTATAKGKTENAAAYRTQASRLREVQRNVENRPVSLEEAASNRVGLFKKAATDPSIRMEGDQPLIGSGWYFASHGTHLATHPEGSELEARHFQASAALSPGVDPVNERRAAAALSSAHHSGYVILSQTLIRHLNSNGENIPNEAIGSPMPIAHLSGRSVASLATTSNQRLRSHVIKQSSGVDWDGIRFGKIVNQIAKAHDILSGRTSISPIEAPKTWGYAQTHALSRPNSPEEKEYQMRADHLAGVLRGEVHPGQQMLDFFGLRNSNEGILSNRAHTAEDSWMMGISSQNLVSNPSHIKAVSDAPLRRTTTDSGPVYPTDTRIKPITLRHTWENKATSLAAEKLQHELGVDYTVPATMMQEVPWTVMRRSASTRGGMTPDKDFQVTQTARKKEVDAAHKAALKENAQRSNNASKQMDLFEIG